MRLRKVGHGHALRERVTMWMMRVMLRARVPDVVRTLMYRPRFFGRGMLPLVQQVMRGPSAWSPGERELMAAFVSRLNHCPF